MEYNESEELIEMRRLLEKREAAARSERLRISAIILMLSFAGAVFSGYKFYDLVRSKKTDPLLFSDSKMLTIALGEIAQLKQDVSDLRRTVAMPVPVKPESQLTAEQARLSGLFDKLDHRLSSLEAAILESPEKSLSIPLLRKEVGDVSKRVDESRTLFKVEIDRLYELQKWMLGGIGAVLVTVAGSAVTILLRSLPKAKDE
jgi:hypothetical protein